MWIIKLLLAWGLLYVFFRWIIFGGKDTESKTDGKNQGDSSTYDRSHYLSDDPDILKPDIEPDEFDPTDYF